MAAGTEDDVLCFFFLFSPQFFVLVFFFPFFFLDRDLCTKRETELRNQGLTENTTIQQETLKTQIFSAKVHEEAKQNGGK